MKNDKYQPRIGIIDNAESVIDPSHYLDQYLDASIAYCLEMATGFGALGQQDALTDYVHAVDHLETIKEGTAAEKYFFSRTIFRKREASLLNRPVGMKESECAELLRARDNWYVIMSFYRTALQSEKYAERVNGSPVLERKVFSPNTK